jgi:hypothetical protein
LPAVIATVGLLAALFFVIIKFLSLDVDGKLNKEIEVLLGSMGGVRSPIDPTQLKKLYDQADFPSMLGWIKNSMRLDLRVGMRVVDSGPERTPMWIEMPKVIAPYGTEEFRRTRVIVNVQKRVLNNYAFEWIVAGFAHELAHAVLASIGHPPPHNERAVDLAAMIAGYRNFAVKTNTNEIHGGAAAVIFAIFAPFLGLLFIPGHSSSSLGYLTRGEKKAACRYLEKLERIKASSAQT